MAVSTCGLIGLFMFLYLSLGSANRVLKNQNAESDLTGHDLASEQDLHNKFSHAGLKSSPINSVGSSNGCCNYGNCGQCGGGGGGCGFQCQCQCPPNPSYGCGGNSGCPYCYTPPPCQWQGCQGPPPSCGCVGSIQNSEVHHESDSIANPLSVGVIPPTNQANQNLKANGGLV